MSSIKICFVSREYAHNNMGKTGGIGVFLKQYTHELKKQDFEIVVFSFGNKSKRFNDNGVNIIKIKDLSGFNEWIKAPLRRYKVLGYLTIKKILEFLNRLYISMYLSTYVQKHSFDLIEFHDYGGDAPYFIGKLPKIVRCHGTALTLHQFMGYYKRQPDASFETVFFKRFHKYIVAVSEFSAQMTMKAFHLKTKPKVIYNGIKVPEFVTKKDYLDTPSQEFSVFYFGSIRERKGINIACETFNEIVKQFPQATFHVLGNNNNNHWNQVAMHILSPRAVVQTTYYGTVPNADINLYLKKAHVVLFPSYGENFSIALLEVMALGKIAITSNIPAFNEIIKHGENGLIAGTIEDYIKLTNNVFKNKVNIDLISKNAKLTIIEKFESSHIIKQNINYYKSILKC